MNESRQISLLAFDGGRIETRGVRFIRQDGHEETRDMADPNHCYLIRHPDGLLMWDSGLPDAIAAMPEHALQSGRFRFVVNQPLAAQMGGAGVQPEEVNLLAFSHLQIDHAGNAGLFHSATVLIQAAEYAMAFDAEAEDWGYRREDYEVLAGRTVIQLNGDYDVFGDGRVMVLAAPGHTPGHQVLYVDLPQEGPALLSGDLYYAPQDPIEGWMPAWNYDKEQTRQTMERLENFAREKGARWIINHDPAGSR